MKKASFRRLMDFAPEDFNNKLKKKLIVIFEDGELEMSAHEVIVSRYIWETVKDFIINKGMKLYIRHSISSHYVNGFYTSRTLNKTLEKIYEDLVLTYFEPNNSREGLEIVWKNMQVIFNRIYNEIVYKNIAYVTSINIDDLLEIQLKPELVEKMRDVYNLSIETDNILTNRVVDETYYALDKILKENPRNAVSQGYISSSLNPNQVRQVLGSRGSATTATNTIFAKPIANSFTTGMYNMYEIIQESAVAARSLLLSTTSIAQSEYFARLLQLVCMSVEKLVDGDCGQTDYIDWYVKPYTKEGVYSQPSDLPNLEGKYFYNPETGKEELITKAHKHLEGTTIKLRVAYKCKLHNKSCICAKCFGAISYNIPKHINLGWYCCTQITKEVSQRTLSDKHHTASSISLPIIINPEAVNDFYTKENDNTFVYLRYKHEEEKGDGSKVVLFNNKKDYKLTLKVFKYSANGLGDIKPDTEVRKFIVETMSYLEDLWLEKMDVNTGEVESIPVSITKGVYYGSFTVEFLEYIKENGYELSEDDYYHIDLSKWKFSNPIVKVNDVSFNYIMLAKEIKAIFGGKDNEKEGENYLNLRQQNDMLLKLFNVINNKLSINIALLEVIVYAFSVTDYEYGDYSLGRNGTNISTRSISDIMTKTSLGGAYAWERHMTTMLNPYAFKMKNAREHILDALICPNEVMERYNSIK